MKVLTILFLFIIKYNYCVCQVFKNNQIPPPPTLNKSKDVSHHNAIFTLDTLLKDHNFKHKLLEIQDSTPILKELKKLNHSQFAETNNNVYVVGTITEYQEGTLMKTDLNIYAMDTQHRIVATNKISHKKGITIISVTSDQTDFYVMYNKTISTSDRDLYISKFNNKAKEIWSYNLGKRFGTRGLGLLKMIDDKTLIALTSHYNKVGFDILSSEGEYQKRKELNVIDELNPHSLIIDMHNEIVVVGSLNKYRNSNTYSSAIVFKVDQNLEPTFYKEFSSNFTDYGLDIKTTTSGDYVILTNSVKFSGPYNERYKFSTLLLLDESFQIKETFSIKNNDDSSKNRLAISKDNSIYFYQKNRKLEVYMLTENLELINSYNFEPNFRDPSYMKALENNKLIIGGGGSRSSWLIETKE